MTDKQGCGCGPDCCSDSRITDATSVLDKVREGYGEIARSGKWSGVPAEAADGGCCSGGGCCGSDTLTPDQVAEAVGYSGEDLDSIPEGSNLGLSCGNPTALASLREGETVLDLGSGAGFDCFIAGPRVGADGSVIGVDMTPDMLSRARAGLDAYRERSGLDNVEFRLGEIGHLPVADSSVDVVISNCVLNLAPDKARVWREIARVLKPGGRVAVSDLALLQPLPGSIEDDLQALVGCVAGAAPVEETRRDATDAGLEAIELDSKPQYIEAMSEWQDPLYRKIISQLPDGAKTSDYITSLDVRAVKPA